jgi:3-phosphoshikimate 1-carboxyvinyltransferase
MNGAEVLPATRPLRGTASVPADKAISHRGAILGALANGTTIIHGYSAAGDCRSTLAVLRGLGVAVDEDGNTVRVAGWGARGPAEPRAPLDCGRSGTTMRLMSGALAGFPVKAVLTGDPQLLARPMERVAEPLRAMGATVATAAGGVPPIGLRGGSLHGIDYELPVASAQVKSAVLLAGLRASGATTVTEPVPSRDHTERMLRAMGAAVDVSKDGDGRRRVRVEPSGLEGVEVTVPGDPSSAAPLLVAAALVSGSDLTVAGVGLNPTRTGLLDALRRMGAEIEATATTDGSEPIGDVRILQRPLRGTVVDAPEIPSMVDEIPLLGLLATQADGVTEVRGAEELRVKESDRIAVLANGLTALGADVEELPDGFVVTGPTPLHAGYVKAAGDHRMAMTFAVAALIASGPVHVSGMQTIADSFPGFMATLQGLR